MQARKDSLWCYDGRQTLTFDSIDWQRSRPRRFFSLNPTDFLQSQMVKAKHLRPIWLGSLQVWYSNIRYHLRSPASLTHLTVNHLCRTAKDFYWRGELFSRPSTFSIFHFGSLLMLLLLTYTFESHQPAEQLTLWTVLPWVHTPIENVCTHDHTLWHIKPVHRDYYWFEPPLTTVLLFFSQIWQCAASLDWNLPLCWASCS